MKIPLDVIEYVLKQHSISPAIASEIKNKAIEIEQEKEVRETVKKQYAIVVSKPEGQPESDLVGWVVQIPEDDSILGVVQRISDAAREFNQTPKGRRLPVQSIGEGIEVVPARFFKEENVWIKTKEPVLVAFTDNKLLPRSASE